MLKFSKTNKSDLLDERLIWVGGGGGGGGCGGHRPPVLPPWIRHWVEHSSPDLHARIHSQRKKRRDVRELFEPNEGISLTLSLFLLPFLPPSLFLEEKRLNEHNPL